MKFFCPAESAFSGLLSRYIPLSVPIAVGPLAGYMIKHCIDTRVLDEQIQELTPSQLHKLIDRLT